MPQYGKSHKTTGSTAFNENRIFLPLLGWVTCIILIESPNNQKKNSVCSPMENLKAWIEFEEQRFSGTILTSLSTHETIKTLIASISIVMWLCFAYLGALVLEYLLQKLNSYHNYQSTIVTAFNIKFSPTHTSMAENSSFSFQQKQGQLGIDNRSLSFRNSSDWAIPHQDYKKGIGDSVKSEPSHSEYHTDQTKPTPVINTDMILFVKCKAEPNVMKYHKQLLIQVQKWIHVS
ncbi:hypothetical protein Bhyg_15391 [Pseudolycoriella hygida]|uniref:Uncharacterized protein n=1 Tax=Pseudolycoriella hygida TaxID=35572 RepID=A0A9Q0MRW6_9DIPT|nr:hypothetical protein Bhyg_15391 [Pseudolycoriella hygida]